MANTTNFGWETPDNTDLVKDGALAIRTLGSAIDTSLVDLKGGTTGQVLSKASNTDMDFSWTAADPLVVLDAKGDLITATAADTPARLAVGTNNHVLTADSTTSTGLKWAAVVSGGMTLLTSGTLSGASVLLSSISGSYKDLMLVIRNFRPATDNRGCIVRFNDDSNANRHYYATSTSADAASFNQTNVYIISGTDNGATQGLGIMRLYDYANTTTWKMGETCSITNDKTTSTNFEMRRYFVGYNQTSAISSLRLAPEDGNFTSGDYYLYGVN
jgi:hypothetical protein